MRLATALALGLALPASAAQIAGSEFYTPNFAGAAFTDDATGKFSYCTAWSVWDSGDEFYVSMDAQDQIWFLFRNPKVTYTPGQLFDATMVLDVDMPWAVKAEATSADYVRVLFTGVQPVIAWAGQASFVRLLGANNDQLYAVDNLDRAMALTAACVMQYGFGATAPAAAQPSAPPPPPPPSPLRPPKPAP
jgi:hypothetical protein